jgi:hypothetical protein
MRPYCRGLWLHHLSVNGDFDWVHPDEATQVRSSRPPSSLSSVLPRQDSCAIHPSWVESCCTCNAKMSWQRVMQRGYDEDWLGDTFSRAVLLGNGLVAILAGLVGNYLVGNLQLPRVAPFDAAIVVLLLGGATIVWTWPENYGDHSTSRSILEQFRAAYQSIVRDRRILLLGVMQVCFLRICLPNNSTLCSTICRLDVHKGIL